jgi:hypothetical protein
VIMTDGSPEKGAPTEGVITLDGDPATGELAEGVITLDGGPVNLGVPPAPLGSLMPATIGFPVLRCFRFSAITNLAAPLGSPTAPICVPVSRCLCFSAINRAAPLSSPTASICVLLRVMVLSERSLMAV